LAVSITSSILSSAAVTNVVIAGGDLSNTVTPAAFSSGAMTFHLDTNKVLQSTQFSINLVFSGSTPIPNAAAGTVNLTFGRGNAASAQAAAAASGSTAKIDRGGFNAELNTFLGSSNTSFTSFARIHNNGVAAGTATVTVVNDATGATMGSSFSTSTIASGQTLQLSNKDIETSAGVTAAAGQNYTVQITGAFVGYAQHIIFNPATGQLADLSGFRNKLDTSSAP
jgi:hypothetical protein